MKITKTVIEVTIEVDPDRYEAYGSWESPARARLFEPTIALVGPTGTVHVQGHRVKKDGTKYAEGSTIEYWGWGPHPARQPEFVKKARSMAQSFRECADAAWATELEESE